MINLNLIFTSIQLFKSIYDQTLTQHLEPAEPGQNDITDDYLISEAKYLKELSTRCEGRCYLLNTRVDTIYKKVYKEDKSKSENPTIIH